MPTPRARHALLAVALAGCNAVLGLDEPSRAGDAAVDGVVELDAAVACRQNPGGNPDEDGDGRRDDCDNCPHVDQPGGDQDDRDLDGVGDVCDPHPGEHDTLLVFDGFAGDQVSDRLSFVADNGAPGGWSIGGGQLLLVGTAASNNYLARLDLDVRDLVVEARVTPRGPFPVLADGASRSVGLWAEIADAPDQPAFPAGVVLESVSVMTTSTPTTNFHLVDTHAGGPVATSPPDARWLIADDRYVYRLACRDGECTGAVLHDATPGSLTIAAPVEGGDVGIRSFGLEVAVDYLVAYTVDR